MATSYASCGSSQETRDRQLSRLNTGRPSPPTSTTASDGSQKEYSTKRRMSLRAVISSQTLPRVSSYHRATFRPASPNRTKTPRRASAYPEGDFRNSSAVDLMEIKSDVMCSWLHQQQLEKMWSSGSVEEGVMLKKGRDDYTCCPRDLQYTHEGLFDAVKKLNVRCAMTVNTRIINVLMRRQNMPHIPLENGLRLQILPDVIHLHQCQKHHFAALIRNASILIVWDDDPNHLLERVQNFEDQLMSMIWKGEAENDDQSTMTSGSNTVSKVPDLHINGMINRQGEFDERMKQPPRKVALIQSALTALTLVIVIAAIGTGWREIAIEIKYTKSWRRLAFLAVVPFQCWLALFFMQSVVNCIAQIIGPISQMTANTKFFSGQAPQRLSNSVLPHVTIQCPVYKEGLWSVIDPTIKSIKAAISTYEMQGGSANIFINDDGMQLLSEGKAQERREYYDEHNIGWVGRPKHNPKPADTEKAFTRAGKFKKASNMNYALNISARVEDRLALITRQQQWSEDLEHEIYHAALAQVIEQDEGRTWAEGNVRIGDYILLVDSDTRVPVDCFLDAVSEMEASPEVAIIQFSSGVMNVTTSWFEKGVTFFTNWVYSAITYAVANGDVAPFVGHNAFLRWSAVQDVAYLDQSPFSNTEVEKYWSESTVSEDFDLALRLQASGYILRLAAYAGQGFKEGVSLTVYDELARWKKYAYGCSELIFHPFRHWLTRGPFTPLFRRFIFSTMPLASKITIMAYVGTYFAIGSAWILTLANYALIGWFNGHLDHYYVDSFRIYFAIVMIFSLSGSMALGILRYRTEERTLFSALFENFKWIPMLTIFLGGISLHVSQAILCHLFSIDMSWGATNKEASDTSFFEELPVIARKFWMTFAWCIGMVAMMVVLSGVGGLVPWNWRVTLFTAVYPLSTVVASHFLLPLVLNPGLMQFTF